MLIDFKNSLTDLGEIQAGQPWHGGFSSPIFTNMQTNTSPNDANPQSTRWCIIWSKGLSHGPMDPRAASTLIFRLKIAFLDYMYLLINESVQRRDERSQD